jgi:hypothetical protein
MTHLRWRDSGHALGYQPTPPDEPDTTWHKHYRARLGGEAAFEDRLFDPEGLRPPIWFQLVPESKAGKNRLHLDLYPTGRDSTLPTDRLVEIVESKRRSGRPGLLRGHARPRRQRVLRQLTVFSSSRLIS